MIVLPRLLLLGPAALCLCAHLSVAEEDLIDFEGSSSPMFQNKVQPVIEPSPDGQGNHGTYAAEGFATIAVIRLPRDKVLKVLEESPILTGKAKAQASENSGKFLDVTLSVNTDVDGEAKYSPAVGLHFNPLTSGDGIFEFDLSQLKTEAHPSVLETARAFASGQGTFFQISLVQHSPKGTPSKVAYDNLKLRSR